MVINAAFLGHGIITQYSVTNAIDNFATYNSPNPAYPPPTSNLDRFICALRDMRISYVWVHLFSRGVDVEDRKDGSRAQRLAFLKRLNAEGIPWAGWGYCGSATSAKDLKLIKQFKADPDVSPRAFVVDAEPEKNDDPWKLDAFTDFMKAVAQEYAPDDLALSTWPVLYLHEDDNAHTIMQAAAPFICAFAPQVYWLSFPKVPTHYTGGYTHQDYPPNDPISYLRLCLDDWTKYINKWKAADPTLNPRLIVTGEAYWGSDGSPSQQIMEDKLNDVVANLSDAQWQRIIGFNWYDAGEVGTPGEGSMSSKMIASISSHRLDQKPYLKVAPLPGA